MKVKSYILVLACLFVMDACVAPPDDFPSVPQISFNSMEYVETNQADSLMVTINFRDAEGDLGLNPRDIHPPFNAYDFNRDEQGNLITYGDRPPEAPPFNNLDWVIDPVINNVTLNDTVWISTNPDHFNIFIRFFIKRGGNYQEYDWSAPPFYTTFNGRFPRILNEDRDRAIEGQIQYAMLSQGWNSIFRNDTVRIDIQIQDRQLHKSNVISTPDFTLSSIRR